MVEALEALRRRRLGHDWCVTLGSRTRHLQVLAFIWTKGVRWSPASLQRGVKTHRAQGRSGQGGPGKAGPFAEVWILTPLRL